MGTVKGVGVDKDAVSKHDPVTIVVTAEGHDLDADTWSDANNYIAAGCSFKPGYPTFPGDESHEQSARPAPAPQRPSPAPASQPAPSSSSA